MEIIDHILNLAGLLLWLGWCMSRVDPLAGSVAKSLVGTLKRAGGVGLQSWRLPAVLVGLLLVRAILYWEIGPALDWKPALDIAVVTPRFQSESFIQMLLFSLLSFVRVIIVFYTWLLFLVVINCGVADADPVQKLVRVHLGPVARWPRAVQCLLPVLAAGGLWLAFHPVLLHLGITPHASSVAKLFIQAAIVGAGTCLTLRFVIVFLLLAYLLNSYVYLGRHPIWNFVNLTARNLLLPLRRLPLRAGKIDFSPVVGVALVFVATEVAFYLLQWLFPG